MQCSVHTTQVVALPAGLPAAVVDEILTATESALLRHGARRIRLDTSQHGLVVLADLPTAEVAVTGPHAPVAHRSALDLTPGIAG